MKMRRLLSLVLALVMLSGCCVLLASCAKKDGKVKISSKEVTLDLTDFQVLYEDSWGSNYIYKELMADFAAELSEKTGKSKVAKTVTSSKSDGTKEILIGETGRAESTKAKDAIKGNGFTVRVDGDKIVIIGSSKILTMQALFYFLGNYLSKVTDGAAATFPAELKANKLEMIPLASSSACDVSFVYGAGLNDSNRYGGQFDLITVYAAFDNRDYPYAAVEDLIERIAAITGLKAGKSYPKIKDSETATGAEFTVGIVERDAVKSCLAELDGGQYCFRVEKGQYLMTAWNDASLMACYDVVAALLEAATVTGADGSVSISFPEGFELIGRGNQAWVTDFPKPDGVTLYNTLDTAENSLQYLYLGEGVSADAFRAYGEKLKGEGYSVLMENEIEGSLFATYVSEAAKLMIYVAFNAYTHQAEFGHEFEKALRVVVSPTESVHVPDSTLLAPQAYQKIPGATTSVTAVELGVGSVGMSYVVTLEDGRFIIFDGGMLGTNTVTTELWNILCARHQQLHGSAPSAANPVRIAAWVITHSHGDHYAVARNMISNYGKNQLFKLENLIGNYPSESAVWPIYNSDIGTMGASDSIAGLQKNHSFNFLKVHAGQRYYFANLEIEVLTTYEDLNPFRINNQNDTNTVLRFSFKQEGAEDYVMVWAGDANREQSRFMCAMYGDYLKGDLVQVAHHGNIGCENDFYDQVGASVVLFPNRLSTYQTYLNPANRKKGYWYDVDQKLIYENTNTQYVFVSEGANTTLPFGADNKPAFEAAFDTLKGTDSLVEYSLNAAVGGPAIKVR